MNQEYFDYEENFEVLLDDLDVELDEAFWDSYDPEQDKPPYKLIMAMYGDFFMNLTGRRIELQPTERFNISQT